MEMDYYLDKFYACADALDQTKFDAVGAEFKVGEWLDSVVLKIQKPTWRNSTPGTIPFKNSIFCSIWVSEQGIKHNKLYYNIHALKLRTLTAYKIQSRDFAEAYRERFAPYRENWPNVSTSYGPLTLMEGWVNLDDLETELPKLVYQFLDTSFLIDELLSERRK